MNSEARKPEILVNQESRKAGIKNEGLQDFRVGRETASYKTVPGFLASNFFPAFLIHFF